MCKPQSNGRPQWTVTVQHNNASNISKSSAFYFMYYVPLTCRVWPLCSISPEPDLSVFTCTQVLKGVSECFQGSNALVQCLVISVLVLDFWALSVILLLWGRLSSFLTVTSGPQRKSHSALPPHHPKSFQVKPCCSDTICPLLHFRLVKTRRSVPLSSGTKVNWI